jgi:hypothetical protein
MAHFAEIDESGVVTRVLVVSNAEVMQDGVEQEVKGVAFLHGLLGHDRWKQTSYNNRIRKNFAGIGFRFDAGRDAFIPPQPFPSWTLNESTCRWFPPVEYPTDGKHYRWDEPSVSWVASDSQGA